MRNALKWFAVVIGGIIGGGIPLSIAFLFWRWVMAQVPVNEWAGLLKIAISFVMLVCGGWLTVVCAGLLAAMFTAMVIAMVEPD